MIEIIISNLIFLLVGFFLRDLHLQSIQKKTISIRKRISNKSGMMEWTPPLSYEEEEEKKIRQNL